MAPKRIVVLVSPKMDEFLERMSAETGNDRSSLIRGWIWEQMQLERDRAIAERQSRQREPKA